MAHKMDTELDFIHLQSFEKMVVKQVIANMIEVPKGKEWDRRTTCQGNLSLCEWEESRKVSLFSFLFRVVFLFGLCLPPQGWASCEVCAQL